MPCNARSKVNIEFICVSFRRISSPRSRSGLARHVVTPAHYQTVTYARVGRQGSSGIGTRRAVYQQRSMSAACSRAEAYWRSYISQRSENQKQNPCWTIRPCRPERCINREQQSESTFGAAVYQQRGVLTAICKGKAYLAQLYINSDQQCEPSPAQPRPQTYVAKLAQPYINNGCG